MAKIPMYPQHPERVCWGCDKYCPADNLACGNGTIRTQHPIELFGEDWLEWANEREHSGERAEGDNQVEAESSADEKDKAATPSRDAAYVEVKGAPL